MNKYFVWIAYMTIVSAIGLMLLIGFWLLYPYKTIDFKNLPFPVNKSEYKPGETLIYTVDYCKYTDVIPAVTRFYVNGVIYLVSSAPAVMKPQGCAITHVQIVIPESLMPDTYSLRISYAYKVNPLRTITMEAITVPFTVTE
jgi:hypothetical protein